MAWAEGDIVQHGIIIRHLAKYRPDWRIDCFVPQGTLACVRDLCAGIWEKEPLITDGFDRVVDMHLIEHGAWYNDRPSTKHAWMLQSVFDIREYDESLGVYQCIPQDEDRHRAKRYLRSISEMRENGRYNVVLVHYQGGSSGHRKNMEDWQASELCRLIRSCGRVPIILDWHGRSPLVDQKEIFNPFCPGGALADSNAGIIYSLIKESEAFIGVDSGPSKIASATQTPVLICWTKNHPLRYHDPAENVDHLIPDVPFEEIPAEAQQYFEKHYRFDTYHGSHGLSAKAQRWLLGKLGIKETESLATTSVVMLGKLQSVAWAVTKMKSVAAGRPLDVVLAGEVEGAAAEFLKRFSFVRSVRSLDLPILQNALEPTNTRGRYVYAAGGQDGYHYLVPNPILETGRRIEEWMPEYPVNWNFWEDFYPNDYLKKPLGAIRYVVFHVGRGDVNHNRGGLWRSEHWIDLSRKLREREVRNIVIAGLSEDWSWWQDSISQDIGRAGLHWINQIEKPDDPSHIGSLLSMLRNAQLFIGCFGGLTVLSHYLGTPTVTWVRPDGNSQSDKHYVCFDERIKDGWTNPQWADRYLGCVYGRETVNDIVSWIDRGGWLK